MEKNWNFEINKGRKEVGGKTQWPDSLSIYIPKDQALTLALEILNQLEIKTTRQKDDFIRLLLSGELEKKED